MKTMEEYNFNQIIDRQGTSCCQLGLLKQLFGRDDLLPLWVADMNFAVCPDITRALVSRLSGHPVYGYTMPADGYLQSIIDWQRSRNGFAFTREEMAFVGGVVTGFALLVEHFTRPGDAIVIQEPVYHPFRHVSEGAGRRIVNNALRPLANGYYEMDFDGLERIFSTEHPRLMVVCNPHNPVGIAWDADTLRRVASLARKYGVVVLSDEIHGDLMLWGNRHVVMATVSDDAAEVTVTMGAPSKTFNIAGIKSSWCVVKNPKLREPFFGWLANNELSSPHLAALVATEAAYKHGGPWLSQCLRYIEGNIDYVAGYCRDRLPGIRAVKPQASFLVWLDCRGLGLDHDSLVSLMVDRARLAMNDGAMFGEAGSGFMRMNVGVPRSVLVEAMGRIEQALR